MLEKKQGLHIFEYPSLEELHQKERQFVFNRIKQFDETTSDAKKFLQSIVDFLETRYEFNFIGAYLVDKETQFADFVAGTGEVSKHLLHRGHRWPLDDFHGATDTVRIAIMQNAICFEFFELIPIYGFFYFNLSSNYEDKSLPRAQFVETLPRSGPMIVETIVTMTLPLRTSKAEVGAIEFHAPSTDMGRGSAIFMLPIVDYIAACCLEKMK